MTNAQKKLKELHGTPVEYEKAIWNAYCDLFITNREAMDAIERYRNEWDQAGRVPKLKRIGMKKQTFTIKVTRAEFLKLPLIIRRRSLRAMSVALLKGEVK